jgi:NADPH2:quinone reductase
MKAVVVSKIGTPDVLEVRDIERPLPAPDQVLVRIEHAGVNMLDTIERRGMFRVPPRPVPYVPGVEGAGTVEAIGSGVRGFRIGERVSFMDLLSGSYAEFTPVRDRLVRIPADIPSDIAAAMTVCGLTAHYLVHEYVKVLPGMSVVVHAAAGGMGMLLTQWLKHYGAVVIGTTSSKDKAEVCLGNGCNHVILYQHEDFAARVMQITHHQGADLILDAVGKQTIPADMQCINERGTIVLYGVPSGKPDPVEPFWLMFGRSVRLAGGDCNNFTRTPEETQARMNAVYDGYRQGWLKPNIAELAPMHDAARIHAALESRGTSGKFVLRVS